MSALAVERPGDGTARLTLALPERRNAFTTELGRQLRGALADVAADPAVRAVVLGGEGPAFCVGGDVREFAGRLDDGTLAEHLAVDVEVFNEVAAALVELPVPVVAALHGAVAGGGLALALGCDLRVCHPGTVFVPAFIALGLAPDTGTSWLLPRVVGEARALDLVLRNRRLDAETALAWGLVNEVADDPAARAAEVAAGLAAAPPRALAATKALVRSSDRRDLRAQLALEAATVLAAARGDELPEGVRAFLERRPPRFGPGER